MATRGEHTKRTLTSGVEVHLVRHPHAEKWTIRSLDISWASQGALSTKTWFPKNVGLDGLQFDTPEAACEFLEKHVRVKAAPAEPEGVVVP